MKQYLTLAIIVVSVIAVIKLLSYKAKTGRYYPEIDRKKATYAFVFFAYLGAIVMIILAAIDKWIK